LFPDCADAVIEQRLFEVLITAEQSNVPGKSEIVIRLARFRIGDDLCSNARNAAVVRGPASPSTI
jgi:hypothetical protein